MKFVTDRKELAKDINIKGLPVLTMDISQPLNGDEFYKDSYGGSKARVAYASRNYGELRERCTLKMFGDEPGNEENHEYPWRYKKIILMCPGSCLHGDFTLHDAREMVEWSHTPILKEGDELYVFFDRGDVGMFRKMKVGKVSPHYSTVAVLEDLDE